MKPDPKNGRVIVCSPGAGAPSGMTLAALEALAGCDRIYVERPDAASRWALSILGRRGLGFDAAEIVRRAESGSSVGVLSAAGSQNLETLRRRCESSKIAWSAVPALSTIDRTMTERGLVFGHDIDAFVSTGGRTKTRRLDGGWEPE
jgi:hypothetical protein